MRKMNGDGNLIGRIGAILTLVAVGFGFHRLNCAVTEICPVMKTDSCCAGASHAQAETPKLLPIVDSAQ